MSGLLGRPSGSVIFGGEELPHSGTLGIVT